MILRLADFLDRQESRVRRVAERLGYAPWLDEFRTYLGDPRLTLEEFWCRYTLMRMETAPKFAAVQSDDDARAFYANPYVLWRQVVHRRHAAWRRVLWTMKGECGSLLEFGCGIAPISAWLAPRRPRWCYGLYDLPSPHFTYGNWRLRRYDSDDARPRLKPHAEDKFNTYQVATALDVFEHVENPLSAAMNLRGLLRPGGYLHWNFVETDGTQLDRATAAQRTETLAYLSSALRLVYERDGYYVSVKP